MTRHSIKKRLLRYLLLTLLVGGVLASGLSFYFAYQEAEEFQDDTLKQVGLLHLTHIDEEQPLANDKEYKLKLNLLTARNLPDWLSPDLKNGFHELSDDQQVLRVWVGETANHQRIAISQPTSERDEIALNSALRTLVPLLLLLPLMGGLIWWGIGRELASVEQLSNHIDTLIDSIPQTLPDHQVPDELQHFILAINRLLSRLHQLFIRQQRFSADAAHELRTPLAALSLQVQNLEQANTLETMHQRLFPLKAGIRRSQRLAEQLLDMNRSQVQAYQKHCFALQPFLLELLSLYWDKAEAKSQQLVLAGQEIQIASHPEALMLILGNALDNAIKYSPVDSHIDLRVQVIDQDVVITLEDTGQGLDTQALQHIFEPFVRANDTSVMGNGLGLAIAKAAAEQLHAKVSLDNKPNDTGLVFTLTHPQGVC